MSSLKNMSKISKCKNNVKNDDTNNKETPKKLEMYKHTSFKKGKK